MKKTIKSLTVTCLLSLFFIAATVSLKAQTTVLTEGDKKTLLVNLSKIIAAVKTDFATLKKGESYLNGNNTLSWQSSVVLFPAYTSNESYLLYFHSYNGKPMPTYTEKVSMDIYSIIDVITPLLKSKGFVETDPRGLFTDWAGKCFRSSETVVQLTTDTKAAKPNTTIDIGKFHYYYEKNSSVEKSNKLGQVLPSNNPEPVAKNNPTPGAKKSFGFIYYTNGKDTAVIRKAFADGPAFKAGLKEGDFIQKINNIPVANKTLAEFADILSKAETIKLVVIRSGKPVLLTITKDYAYKFDRTCLSGDCINGTGVSLSKITEGYLQEGIFKDGELIDGSWFINAKSIEQKGTRLREGQLKEGRYFTGFIRDMAKPNGGLWYKVTNHDLVKFNKITSENFNGEVKCYTVGDNSKCIWEGEFVDGRKEGYFHEYLYDKNLEWSYKISNGVMSNQRLRYLGTDKSITGDVGMNLVYDTVGKTWSGKFSNQDCCYEQLVGVSSFNDLVSKYQYKKESISGTTATPKKNTTGKKAEIEKLGKDVTAFSKSKIDIKSRLMSLPLSIRKNDRDYKEYKQSLEWYLSDIDKLMDKYKNELDNGEIKYLNSLSEIITALYLQIDS